MKAIFTTSLLFFFTASLLFSQINILEPSVNSAKKILPAKADPKSQKATEKIFCYPFGAYSTVPTGPSYFYLSDPNTIYQIASSTTQVFGATWGNGKWYGSDYAGMNLMTIDTASGTETIIGSMGLVMNGLAYDPVTDMLYGVSSTGLYSIDSLAGTLTLIGDSSVASSIFINLACSPSGKLYTVNITDDILYTIDKTTGVATAVGTGLGVTLSYAQDMEYDQSSNILYLAGYTGGGVSGLYEVDTLTGVAGASLGYLDSAEVCGMAIPYAISTVGINDYVENTLSVYPNPATDYLTIPVEENCILRMWSSTGKQVMMESLQTGNFTVNVSELSAGMYYITLSGETIKHAVVVIE